VERDLKELAPALRWTKARRAASSRKGGIAVLSVLKNRAQGGGGGTKNGEGELLGGV